LVDTVGHASQENLQAKTATGFVFDRYSVEALENCLHQACEVFRHQPDTWKQIVETGMQQDWSWLRSAREYELVYSQAISDKQHRA
jgi:starch synthase